MTGDQDRAARAPRRRRTVRGLGTVLIVAGAALMADAGLTVAWQEPLTALLAHRQQDQLRSDLAVLERAAPDPVERRALSSLAGRRRRIAFGARSLARRAREGQAVGRLRIPRIHGDFVVVNGSQPGDLRKGPGLYDDTPFPGAPGTTAIAGHRTTYGAPFRHVDRLRRGDAIDVTMPYATLRYRVEGTRIVAADAVEVTRRVAHDRLILSACHPLFSAAKRIVVFARLDAEQDRRLASSDRGVLTPGRVSRTALRR